MAEEVTEAGRLMTLKYSPRLRKRMREYKSVNPDAKSVKKFKTSFEDKKGKKKITKDYGRDTRHMCKPSWFTDKYDADDSSGDDDITNTTGVS